MQTNRTLGWLVAACLILCCATTAEAQSAEDQAHTADADDAPPPQTRASSRHDERRFYAAAGLGFSFGLNSGSNTKFKLTQEVGYHFLPFGDHPGVFGAITLGESFIQYSILQFCARIGIDFLVVEWGDLTILLAPSAASGLGLYVIPSSVIGTETRGYFDIQIAGDVKVLVGDGGLGFWLRPVSLDFFVNGLVLTRYDVLLGAQISF